MSDPTGVQVERQDAIVVARLRDEVDISRVEGLHPELLASVDNRDLGLVVDLTAATYIDSAGINMLFELAEALDRRQIQLALVVPEKGLVARVASLVGLDSVVPVRPSAETAVTALREAMDPASGD